MSTLRATTLQTLDETFSVSIKDLITADDVPESFVKIANYATLQTTTPKAANEIIYLMQYVSTNQYKGGGVFRAIAGAGTENYGTVCVPNSSANYYWQRINYADITPDMFGAVSNGTGDSVLAFNRALAVCKSAGKRLYIPAGTYYLSSTITVPAGVQIVGESQQQTTLSFADSSHGFTVAASSNYVRFKSLTIRNVSTAKTSGYHGIYANGGSISTGSIGFLDIDDCNIFGFDCAFYGVACQLGIFSNSTFWACNKGIYTKLCVNMRYDECRIQLNTSYGWHADGDSTAVSLSCGTLVNSCEFVNNGASSGGSIFVNYNEHFTINNCMIDVPNTGSTSHVVISNTSRGTISSCWIGASKYVGVNLASCTCVNINGCNILSSGTYGLTLTGSCNGCVINGNSFESNPSGDVSISGTGCLYNVFTGNAFASTTASGSLVEGGNYYTCATGNMAKKAITLATGSGSVSSGNLTLA